MAEVKRKQDAYISELATQFGLAQRQEGGRSATG